VVAFADRTGRFRGLAHTARTDPPELAFACCVEYLGDGADVAVAFCDEAVDEAPPTPAAAISTAAVPTCSYDPQP